MRYINIAAWILLSCFGLSFGQSSFVFLGPGEGSQQPEVISLPLGEGPACELQLQPYPKYVVGAFTFLLPGAGITVCGGGYSTCFSLHPSLGIWEEIISPLPYEVAPGAKAISLQNGDTLVLNAYGSERWLPSTLIYIQETGAWVVGPQMPALMYGFCVLQINSTHTLLVGGVGYDDNDEGGLSANIFMFDGTTFKQVSSLLEPRYEMGCTLNQDGHVVVAGGMGPEVEGGDPDGEPMDSVEIYNPLTDIWAPGPPLPKGLAFFAGMVADGEKLLLIGGYEQDYTNDIHSLVHGADRWELEDTHLVKSNGYLQAIKVTSDSLDC